MPTIRLGINNGFAAKRWPEPNEWSRLVAEEIGLTDVQFSFDLLDPLLPDPERDDLITDIRNAGTRHDLQIRTTFTGSNAYGQNLLGHPDLRLRRSAKAWFLAAIRQTSALGAKATGGHFGAMSVRSNRSIAARNEAIDRLVQLVAELSQTAAASGLRYLLWEMMPSSLEPPHTPIEAAFLLTEVNRVAALPIWLCFDLGHCCAPDLTTPGDPIEWLQELLPWVRMVHLQQTDGRDDRHWPFTELHRARGIIDPRAIADVVRMSEADVIDLVFEFVHPMTVPHRQVIEDYRTSVDQWREVL